MINSKYTKLYLLWLVTTVTLWVTYAYSSISNSLNYLRNEAGDTGHIGYIITEIFWTWWTSNGKIKQQYLELPDSLTFVNSTGSTVTTQAPTINILTQVWDNLNTRINNLSWNISSIDLSTKVDKNANITAWTATKITYDAKWLVTTGTSLSATDIPVLDTWKITSGTFNIERLPTGTTSTTVSVWNHWHSNATTSVSGFMSSTDKTKLDGIAANANNYIHPANHPASIITQDASNRFVTDTEKANWNAKADINSPTFTGTPSMTNNPAAWDNTTKIATTARVKANTASAGWTYEISCIGISGTNTIVCIRINTTTWATECKLNYSIPNGNSWGVCTWWNPW